MLGERKPPVIGTISQLFSENLKWDDKKINSQEWNIAQCPRCQVGCSCSKNLPAVTAGAYYPPLATTGACYAQNGEFRV